MKILINNEEQNVNVTIKEGSTLNFYAKNANNNQVAFKNLDKKKKVISLIPKLNTGLCDAQTKDMIKLSDEFIEYLFITISNDSVKIINEWTMENKVPESEIILSDYELNSFKKETGLFLSVDKDFILPRGFIILDEENVVKVIHIQNDVQKPAAINVLRQWLI